MKNINFIFIVLLILYFLFRLFCFLIPVKNVTVLLKDDYCSVSEIVQQTGCKIHGQKRNDLFTNDIIIKADNGSEIYVNKNIISGYIHESDSN
ncbi:hypothetical protein [Acinetobacter baumannii]|uniref:hypothetical protein n=1 Tax=Acinetobacter baumannii TaxID=470 RepID=UPI002342205B|nr:hypothetical protein [Acinetobacter baumannii]MDC4147559.1 hypothetical protein [Acinetobacter baumannii]